MVSLPVTLRAAKHLSAKLALRKRGQIKESAINLKLKPGKKTCLTSCGAVSRLQALLVATQLQSHRWPRTGDFGHMSGSPSVPQSFLIVL